jgi:hypothetical protein
MKNKMLKKLYYLSQDKVPFISNIRLLYNYSNWINEYRRNIRDEEVYRSKFDSLCRNVYSIKCQDKLDKPIIIMTTYNDHDIIEAIIEENHLNGYEQIIIDNWSTDGTWSIISKMEKKYNSILNIKQFPFNGPTNDYRWKDMLDIKSKIALDYKNRWIIHQDSDEFTISPLKNFSIEFILKAIENMGYNAISVRMLDFTPVDDSFSIGNPIENFNYYRISEIPSYSLQNKIWLQGDEQVDLSCMGGHDVKFTNRRLFPLRLPRFHYSVRSIAHARSKYSPKRLERSTSEREELGWHTHISVKLEEKVIYNKNELIYFDFNELYSDKFHWFINND